MTEINIIVNGDAERKYEFQTLEEEDAEHIAELIINQTDKIIATLDAINSISAEDPPSLDD